VAMGRTGMMMGLQGLAAALNLGLNVLFIQRMGMGVEGAALATVLSRVVTSSLGVGVVWRLIGLRIATDDTLRRLLRVGGPIALNYFAYAGVYFALLRTTISPLGPEVNAALGIGFSALEGVTYPMFLGLSVAVSSVVGRRLGAGEPEEARRAAVLALPLSTGMGVAAGLVFWFGAAPLCGLFSEDPVALREAVLYARVLAFSQLAVSWEAHAEGVLGGAGDSRAMFWLGMPFNVLRVPLAWALAFPVGWGAAGVWWAINATSYLKAIAKGVAAARGGWVRVRV
jgi:multidrug resistance protein, MATE family